MAPPWADKAHKEGDMKKEQEQLRAKINQLMEAATVQELHLLLITVKGVLRK